jgi:hypothetical protein
MTDASQEERAKLLREERQINTRSAMQEVIDPRMAGRFATQSKPDFTIGKDEVVHYPRLPGNSPWQQEQPPPEEPLGFSVEEMPPMGEPHEIAHAYELLSASVGPRPTDSDAGAVSSLGATADPYSPSGSANSAPVESPAMGADLSSSSSSAGLADIGPATLAQHQSAADIPRKDVRRVERSGAGSLSPVVRRLG